MGEILERLLIDVAWFTGLSMAAIGIARIVFLTTHLRPAASGGNWFSPVWLIAAWEQPAVVTILGGLFYTRRWPWPAGAALAVGAISCGVHLYYFGLLPFLALLVATGALLKARRLAGTQPCMTTRPCRDPELS